MRQSALQIDSTAEWKQEVARRLAEHNERKNAGANLPQTDANTPPAPGSRAAAAAARVAARYAKAPSYSEMLADEARAAVRAAEAASKAALEAQAVAESVLAGLEAASSATQTWEVEFFTPAEAQPATTPAAEPAPVSAKQPAQPAVQPAVQPAGASSARQSFEIRWDADLPVREAGPSAGRAYHGKPGYDVVVESLRRAAPDAQSPLEAEGFEVVEPAQPIHANLIEFPRELVATRKVRPRRAEGPNAALMEALGQLSIFEVDPRTVSTEPETSGPAAEAGTATWVGPEWSGIELEEEPQEEMAVPARTPAATEREVQVVADAVVQPASMNRRILAAVMDFSLIASAFVAAGLLAAMNVKTLPSIKAMETGSAVALALTGAFYLALFFILAKATPGMKYAQLEFCTLAGKRPTRAQRCVRLGALMLSILPAGLGVALAIFDEQNLCWHDRLSGTYLRRG
ncbi:MAG: RDD family protein [Terracidiphilus sp.]